MGPIQTRYRTLLRGIVATSFVSLALVFVGGGAGATTAVTLYVSATGSSSTGCTSSGTLACATVADAVAAAQLLTDESVTIDIAASATPYDTNIDVTNTSITLSIVGAGAASTVLDGTNTSQVLVTAYQSTVSVSDVTMEDGYGTFGGDVENDGYLTLTDDVITAGDGGDYGGGVYEADGSLTATNDTFSDDAAYYGGAVANIDVATLTDDTFSNNGSDTAAAGAVYNAAGCTITANDDTFVGNHADDGGAVLDNGTGTFDNDTFFDNGATDNGGAIYTNNSGANVTASFDTFSENTAADYGAALLNYADHAFDVSDSIFNNDGCALEEGANPFTDDGYNVESDDSCGFSNTSATYVSTIDLASALAANGSTGPETLAVSAASKAVNFVPRAACAIAVDERGVARLATDTQSACDAGAIEYATPVTTAPSAPRDAKAVAGNKSLTLSWLAPTSTGGDPLSVYYVYCTSAKKITYTGRPTVAAKATVHSTKVGGLKNGVHYSCVVVAHNAVGASKPSNIAGATPKL